MGGWVSSFLWGQEGGGGLGYKKIVMVGLDNAGKSTILRRLTELDRRLRWTDAVAAAPGSFLSRLLPSMWYSAPGEQSGDHSDGGALAAGVDDAGGVVVPTIGFQVESVRCADGGPELVVWDVGGQSRLRRTWHVCYDGAAAAVFVVDAADLEGDSQRLADAREALHGILAAHELRGVPLLILANKKDDPRALSMRQVLLLLHLATFSTSESSSAPEPVSYEASIAGYTSIRSSSSPVITSLSSSLTFSPIVKGRR